MEYVNQRGSFDDMPVAQIAADFAAMYPGWGKDSAAPDADFAQDAARESQVMRQPPGAMRPRWPAAAPASTSPACRWRIRR